MLYLERRVTKDGLNELRIACIAMLKLDKLSLLRRLELLHEILLLTTLTIVDTMLKLAYWLHADTSYPFACCHCCN